jgi:hypothetical protein
MLDMEDITTVWALRQYEETGRQEEEKCGRTLNKVFFDHF